MKSHRTLQRAGPRRRVSRRKFLGTVGTVTAIGVAGCSSSGGAGGDGHGDGDGGDSGDTSDDSEDESGDGDEPGAAAGDGDSNDDDSEDDSSSASDVACSDLTAGYTAYPGGERPLFSDFEIPTVIADVAEYRPFEEQATVSAVRPLTDGSSEQFHLFISQMYDGQESAPGTLDIHETVGEIDYEGETRPVYKFSQVDRPRLEQLKVALPHGAGENKRYHQVTVQLEVENAPGGEVDETCGAAIDEAALHIVQSLRPNPETTFDGPGAAALRPDPRY